MLSTMKRHGVVPYPRGRPGCAAALLRRECNNLSTDIQQPIEHVFLRCRGESINILRLSRRKALDLPSFE